MNTDDLIGTLETLVAQLDAGATDEELRNYIAIQVRAVVEQAKAAA
jgi:hypothetical protein